MSKVTTPKKKGQKPQKKSVSAEAIHVADKHGKNHAVVIFNLRVMIVPDGNAWFAQGLEIDYAVQGSSVDDVKKKFENGLAATIHHNIRIFGKIDKILRVAPNEEWLTLWHTAKCEGARYSQVSAHQITPKQSMLPFEAIEYTEVRAAA
jgi:hypothetical protein